jgi:hypothetical protein
MAMPWDSISRFEPRMTPRSRQNRELESGYFFGLTGRNRPVPDHRVFRKLPLGEEWASQSGRQESKSEGLAGAPQLRV